MKPWRRRLYLGGLVIGSLLFAYQIYTGYQAIIRSTLVLAQPAWLGLAFGLTITAFALQIMAWTVLMRGLGVYLTWHQVVQGYSLSFLPRYVPGSIWGYLSRGEWLYQSHDIAYVVSYLGSVTEVLAVLSALGLVSGIYFALTSKGLLRLVWLLITIVFLPSSWLVLHLISSRPFFGQLLRRKSSSDATLSWITPRHWGTVVFLYSLLWLCYGATVSLVVKAFEPQQTEWLIQYTFVYGIAWLAGFVAVFVPAGLGVREMALSSLLTATLGILPVLANAVSVMSRFLVSLAELVWVVIGLVCRPRNTPS